MEVDQKPLLSFVDESIFIEDSEAEPSYNLINTSNRIEKQETIPELRDEEEDDSMFTTDDKTPVH